MDPGFITLMRKLAPDLIDEITRRALILETQSCNTGAIAFYMAQGLSFQGFNACKYSYNDIPRHEVRLEMGCLL